jgi:hypothetical protein
MGCGCGFPDQFTHGLFETSDAILLRRVSFGKHFPIIFASKETGRLRGISAIDSERELPGVSLGACSDVQTGDLYQTCSM